MTTKTITMRCKAFSSETVRIYQVRGGGEFARFDDAAARAVVRSVSIRDTVCIETMVRGKVVERIDVTAALSIDSVE
jgi:hypothetical protein